MDYYALFSSNSDKIYKIHKLTDSTEYKKYYEALHQRFGKASI